jgi:hypothetical protein
MSDWDFLYEMRQRGYSPEEIADAAGSGVAPWEQYLSREWIDSKLEDEPEEDAYSVKPGGRFQSRDGFPFNVLEQTEIFQDLIDCAARHFKNTGRYLQVWGELGEIYGEIKFGLCRHETHKAGSDGTIAGKLVEVKTISPEKSGDQVLVKSQGNFEQLLIVRIDRDFQFQGKLIDRSELVGGTGKFLKGRLKGSASNSQQVVPRTRNGIAPSSPTLAPKEHPLVAQQKNAAPSHGDWRTDLIAQVRALIAEAAPQAVEEQKWKKPSNPAGVPAWSDHGIICTAETYKDKVKLTFAKGASLQDPHGLFNASLDGNARRAIDLKQPDTLDPKAFKELVVAAAALNRKRDES